MTFFLSRVTMISSSPMREMTKSPGLGHLALVSEEEPRAGEYLLQLLVVDRLVDVDLSRDEPLVEVHQAAKRPVAA